MAGFRFEKKTSTNVLEGGGVGKRALLEKQCLAVQGSLINIIANLWRKRDEKTFSDFSITAFRNTCDGAELAFLRQFADASGVL